MADIRLAKSRKLSRLNLNVENECPGYISYWCRIAFSRYDNWNMKRHSHSFFELQLCNYKRSMMIYTIEDPW